MLLLNPPYMAEAINAAMTRHYDHAEHEADKVAAVAALVSSEDLALLQRIEDAEDIRAATKVLKEYDKNPAAFKSLAEYKHERQGRA